MEWKTREVSAPDGLGTATVVFEDDHTVALVYPDDGSRARLISAAPELSDSLGCLYGHLENLLSDPTLEPALLALEPGLRISMEQALAVLWKASPK